MGSWRISLLGLAASAAVVVAGCGGSSHNTSTATSISSTTSTTPPHATSGGPSGSTATFCGELTRFVASVTGAAGDSQLAQAKTDFAKLVSDAESINDVPPTLQSGVASAIADLKAINNWVQTKATQSEISQSAVPPAVAAPYQDLTRQGSAIEAYAKSNCG